MSAPIGYWDGIGGSMCAAIMGLDRHTTPYDAWLRFTDPSTRTDISGEEQIIWGNLLEVPVGMEAARRLGIEVVHAPELVKHAALPFMQAHVDFLAPTVGAGLECKNRGLLMLKQYDLINEDAETEDRVLPTEAMQCHHYMTVTGLKRWYLAVLVGGQRLLTFKFDRDEALCARIEQACTEFWGYVERGEPPPPVNVEDCHKLWPSHKTNAVVVDEEFLPVAARRAELKALVKASEEELEFIDFRVKSTMRDAEKMVCGNKTLFTWTQNKPSKEFDVKGALHDLRASELCIAAHTHEKPGARVLRAKK